MNPISHKELHYHTGLSQDENGKTTTTSKKKKEEEEEGQEDAEGEERQVDRKKE